MPTLRRLWFPVAAVLVLAGCRDATAPFDRSASLTYVAPAPIGPRFLRQAPTAPPLETYQVSFWAVDGVPSSVTVNYEPVAGESVGQPFLRFGIPRNALATTPDGRRLRHGDSVLVILTIDPVNFSVDFQPTGMVFSRRFPAELTFWYQNADPDLNGDGVVDAADQECAEYIALWGRSDDSPWFRLPSTSDASLPSVSTIVSHFSEYAVSW